jgi:hypothetical protein
MEILIMRGEAASDESQGSLCLRITVRQTALARREC